jgi:hypothetical protein
LTEMPGNAHITFVIFTGGYVYRSGPFFPGVTA